MRLRLQIDCSLHASSFATLGCSKEVAVKYHAKTTSNINPSSDNTVSRHAYEKYVNTAKPKSKLHCRRMKILINRLSRTSSSDSRILMGPRHSIRGVNTRWNARDFLNFRNIFLQDIPRMIRDKNP